MRDSLHIRPVVQTFSVSSLLVGRNYWTNSRVASDMLRHCNVSKRHVTLFMELNVVSEGRCDWRGLLSTAPSPLVWRFRTSVYAIRRHCLRGICNIFYTKWGNPISYCFIVITENLNCDMLLTFTTAYMQVNTRPLWGHCPLWGEFHLPSVDSRRKGPAMKSLDVVSVTEQARDW